MHDPAHLIADFDDPARDAWQRPDALLDHLGDLTGKTVIDIGAGSGYFTFRLVERGVRVIAADVDADFQRHLAGRKAALQIPDERLSLRRLRTDSPGLSTAEGDVALVINTYHHVDDRLSYFAQVAEGLRPGGKLVVVDFRADPAVEGPPLEHRLAAATVVDELRAAGFTKVDLDTALLPRQYVIEAYPPAARQATSAGSRRANFERAAFWDDRYAADTSYVYGRSPNGFFQEVIDGLPAGRALLVAEGEGRNAVYAAREGWAVRAIDFSAAAREKALALAAEAGASIDYELADATTYATEERFDLIAIVFLHLGPGERRAAYRRYAHLLTPGGRLAVVLYHPDQLGKLSGGPKQAAWLVDAEELDATLGDLLVTERLEAGDEVLEEGPYHTGLASTTRYVGRKR